MTVRRIIPVALLVLAGILSLSAALFGGIYLVSGDQQANTGLHLMFCIPLILLLPFFCVTFIRPRLSIVLQLCAAVVFLAAELFINTRNCGASHLCPGFLTIALSSFLQPMTLVPFMIPALQTLTIYMREPEQIPRSEHRSI